MLFRSLLEHTVGTVTRGLRASTGGAGLDVVFDVRAYSWPCVFASDEVECTALPIVTRKRMVVFEGREGGGRLLRGRRYDHRGEEVLSRQWTNAGVKYLKGGFARWGRMATRIGCRCEVARCP